MMGRMRDDPNADSTGFMLLLIVLGIGLGWYLYRLYHKPNRKLPLLDDSPSQ